MSPIDKLSVRQLVAVLKHAKNGSIGFDPFRDPRTSTRTNLLKYLVAECSNEQIIAGIQSLTEAKEVTQATEESKEVKWDSTTEAKQVTAVMPQVTASHASDPAQQLAVLLRQLAESNSNKASVDLPAIQALLKQHDERQEQLRKGFHEGLMEVVQTKLDALKAPTVVHFIKDAESAPKDMGIQHKCFPTLLKAAQARTKDGHKLNIWLKGPAGSGKTTAAKHIASALDTQFQFNGAISTEYELMGFKDAHGTYHRTAFREIFENGGVYLFDEVDSSLPKAVLAFNAALANGECRFPDGMIQRHKDCLVLAGANTLGNGATSDYAGRMKQDRAFLDRFVKLEWPLDETLETALTGNTEWCKRVQSVRAKTAARAIKDHIVSPRATFYGEALLAAGIDITEVEHMTVRAGLTDETWAKICP